MYATAPLTETREYCDLETAAGFSYRSALGALIYAYVVARPDIGHAVTTLARFSDHPAKIHYNALRRVARYLLSMTKHWGLLYWRRTLIPPAPSTSPSYRTRISRTSRNQHLLLNSRDTSTQRTLLI